MSWFKREDHEIVNDSKKTVRTEGLWIRCPDCGKILFKAELEANQQVSIAAITSESTPARASRIYWNPATSWLTLGFAPPIR